MALCGQVIDFRWPNLLQEADQIGGVCQIAVMEKEVCLLLMRIEINVVDAGGIKGRRSTLDAMHHIALLQEKSSQKGAILPRDPRDQRNLVRHHCALEAIIKNASWSLYLTWLS